MTIYNKAEIMNSQQLLSLFSLEVQQFILCSRFTAYLQPQFFICLIHSSNQFILLCDTLQLS